MSYCQEFANGHIRSIHAIPVGECSVAPASMLSPTVPTASLTVSYSNAIVIGRDNTVSDAIPFISGTVKISDSEDDNVAGRLHTVKLSCEADDRNADVLTLLRRLERTPHCLLVTFASGTKSVVMADRDSYLCTVDNDDGEVKMSIKIYNLSGIQRVVDL